MEAGLGIDIIELDIFSLAKELRSNPGAYGFANTTDSALLTGHAADAAEYLYWDTVHPTTRVHQVFADAVPEPASAVLLLLGVFGFATRRRRDPWRLDEQGWLWKDLHRRVPLPTP